MMRSKSEQTGATDEGLGRPSQPELLLASAFAIDRINRLGRSLAFEFVIDPRIDRR
jgi:hypothetical protein